MSDIFNSINQIITNLIPTMFVEIFIIALILGIIVRFMRNPSHL